MNRFHRHAGVMILAVLCLTACSGPATLVEPAAPEVTVLAVPGMH